jgi:RimJ/RimL family protein N-acetyltransferase
VSEIKRILAHPRVYKYLHDDYTDPCEQWEPINHPSVLYVSCRDEGGAVIGMYILNIHSRVCVEIHEGFLPEAWGAKARRAAIELREWIWRETQFQRVIGKIVASNHAAIEYAKSAGMEIFGVDKKSFMRDGKLQDQVYVGISRPEGK